MEIVTFSSMCLQSLYQHFQTSSLVPQNHQYVYILEINLLQFSYQYGQLSLDFNNFISIHVSVSPFQSPFLYLHFNFHLIFPIKICIPHIMKYLNGISIPRLKSRFNTSWNCDIFLNMSTIFINIFRLLLGFFKIFNMSTILKLTFFNFHISIGS